MTEKYDIHVLLTSTIERDEKRIEYIRHLLRRDGLTLSNIVRRLIDRDMERRTWPQVEEVD
jgi:hypothetical protein